MKSFLTMFIALGFFDYERRPDAVLAHLRGLTKHILVASFPSVWAFRVPFRKIWLNLRRCPVHFFTQTQIRKLCRDAGFKCKTLFRSGPIFLLIAEPDPEGLAGDAAHVLR
jgi:hypothetical protein